MARENSDLRRLLWGYVVDEGRPSVEAWPGLVALVAAARRWQVRTLGRWFDAGLVRGGPPRGSGREPPRGRRQRRGVHQDKDELHNMRAMRWRDRARQPCASALVLGAMQERVSSRGPRSARGAAGGMAMMWW